MIRNTEDMFREHEIRPLTSYTEFLTDWYIDTTTPKYRKKKGQFFTPEQTSQFMVRQFVELDKKENDEIKNEKIIFDELNIDKDILECFLTTFT